MTNAEIESVLEQLDARKLTAPEAIAQLDRGGLGPELARETVFVALGGSNIIEGDRYVPSGRLVNEVEADMQT